MQKSSSFKKRRLLKILSPKQESSDKNLKIKLINSVRKIGPKRMRIATAVVNLNNNSNII